MGCIFVQFQTFSNFPCLPSSLSWFIEKCATCLISKFGEMFLLSLSLPSSVIPLWLENICCIILTLSNASFLSQHRLWSTSMNGPCMLEKNAVLLLEGGLFSKCQLVQLADGQFCPAWFCRQFYQLLSREVCWHSDYNCGLVRLFRISQFLHHVFCSCC